MKDSRIPLPQALCGVATVLLGSTLGFVVLSITTGCGSDAAKKLSDKAKTAVKNVATNVQQQTVAAVQNVAKPKDSLYELTIEGVKEPLKIAKGKAEIAILENRPIAINFTTSASRDTAAFPNVLVSIQGKGKSIGELVGKQHPARIFIQMKPGQLMYTTQRDKPAMVTIEGGDDTFVSAKFEKAELFDSSGQETLSLTGKLVGLTPVPPKPAEDKDKKGDPKKADEKQKAGAK